MTERRIDSIAGPDAPGELDLKALAGVLWARRAIIAGLVTVAVLGAVGFVMTATPRYSSEARLLIESGETSFVRPEGDRGAEGERTMLDPEAVASQVQVLQSRDLARMVVRELKLHERTDFSDVGQSSPLSRLLVGFGVLKGPSQASLEERVLEEYYQRLTVYQVDKSRVIAVEFKSSEPELAARISNAVAEGYLAMAQAAKHDKTRRASEWLSTEIDQLRRKVVEAESKVEQFRARSNLFVGRENTTLSAQGLGELNSQLILARTQQADAETKSRLIRQLLRTNESIESSEIINSEIIRRLSEQRASAQAQLAEQLTTLMDQHPRVRELRSQIADLERQIRGEAMRLARAFENDARIAAGRVETMTASLDQMKGQAGVAGDQDVQLRALEREARAQRELLESMLVRYRDASARDSMGALPADARIISRASPAGKPSFPKPVPTVIVSALAAAFLSIGFIATGALVSGQALRRAESETLPAEETREPKVEAPEPAPVHDAIPALAARLAREARPSSVFVLCPTQTGIRGPAAAIALARALSRERRVVMVDLAASQPSLQGITSDPAAAGLSDLLAGQVEFGQIVTRDRASAAHLVTAGAQARQLPQSAGDPRRATIFEALRRTYDIVLVLCDPVMVRALDADLRAMQPKAIALLTGEGDAAETQAARAYLGDGGLEVVGVVIASEVGGERQAA
jgi:uncharacterized protein involved in exopolysaccharide biosynthesis/Mrp family chromosome partitioning ATPase